MIIMGWFFKQSTESPSSDLLRQEQLKKIAEYQRFILVRVSRCGCKSAISLLDKVFQINEAPVLPLPSCNSPECRCVYEGIVDRRGHKSRRYRIERRRSLRQSDDRRSSHGRRKSDLLMGYQHY
jgi:hypothetical protein